MDLRYAAMNDLQGVYTLICELEEEEMPFGEFECIYCRNINNEDVHYLVVEDAGQIIGFGSVHIQRLLHHSENVAEVQELVIKDNCRGKGIGLKIMEKLKEISKERSCELIEVCCNRKRVDSHEFYEACGFIKSHYKFTLRWK